MKKEKKKKRPIFIYMCKFVRIFGLIWTFSCLEHRALFTRLWMQEAAPLTPLSLLEDYRWNASVKKFTLQYTFTTSTCVVMIWAIHFLFRISTCYTISFIPCFFGCDVTKQLKLTRYYFKLNSGWSWKWC